MVLARIAAVSVRLNPEDKAELERVASEDGRTVSQFVERLILAAIRPAPAKATRKK